MWMELFKSVSLKTLLSFSFRIIYCTYVYPLTMYPPFFGYYFLNCLLMVLQCLHIFWFALILRMAIKFLPGNVSLSFFHIHFYCNLLYLPLPSSTCGTWPVSHIYHIYGVYWKNNEEGELPGKRKRGRFMDVVREDVQVVGVTEDRLGWRRKRRRRRRFIRNIDLSDLISCELGANREA